VSGPINQLEQLTIETLKNNDIKFKTKKSIYVIVETLMIFAIFTFNRMRHGGIKLRTTHIGKSVILLLWTYWHCESW
jgi:hypothetical protein